MLAMVLSTRMIYFIYTASKPYDVSAVIPLMLPMRILELGEVKWLDQNYTIGRW